MPAKRIVVSGILRGGHLQVVVAGDVEAVEEEVVCRIHGKEQLHSSDIGPRYEPQRTKNIRGVMKKIGSSD